GADPNLADRTGRLTVQAAAHAGFDDVVQLLVRRGAKIPDIVVAASTGHTAHVAAFLKAQPAQVKVVVGRRITPLHLAARTGHVAVVRQLLAAGAPVEPATERDATPLHVAAANGHLEVVRVLLTHGAGVARCTRPDSYTPLHAAVLRRHH